MQKKENLRTKQKLETRRKLMDAAIDLFMSRGYEAVSLEQVAEHAQIHVQTLYRHFKNKSMLACAYFDSGIDQIIYQLDRVSPQQDAYRVWKKSSLSGLNSIVNGANSLQLFQMIHANPELLAHNLSYARKVEDKLTEVLQKQEDRLHLNPHVSRLLAASMTTAYRESHYSWIYSDGKVSSVDMLNEYFEVIEKIFDL